MQNYKPSLSLPTYHPSYFLLPKSLIALNYVSPKGLEAPSQKTTHPLDGVDQILIYQLGLGGVNQILIYPKTTCTPLPNFSRAQLALQGPIAPFCAIAPLHHWGIITIEGLGTPSQNTSFLGEFDQITIPTSSRCGTIFSTQIPTSPTNTLLVFSSTQNFFNVTAIT